jgi:hypothetical protein
MITKAIADDSKEVYAMKDEELRRLNAYNKYHENISV